MGGRILKTIIAGGRNTSLTQDDIDFLDQLNITEVVSGCARGIDTEGEVWAEVNQIPIKRFPADWDRYGKGAGFKRNAEMAKYAEQLVVFPGGNGTNHMYCTGLQNGLIVHDRR